MAVFQLSCIRPEQKLIKVNERFLFALMALNKVLCELTCTIQCKGKKTIILLPWETCDTGMLSILSNTSFLAHPGPYPITFPENIFIFNVFLFKIKSC